MKSANGKAVAPALAAFAEAVGGEGNVAVEGNKTRWATGGELMEGTRLLTAPSGVVEYTAAEMTVTVRAGTPVSELHEVLLAEGQRTALPERGGTVGGAICVGENDLEVLGKGRVRNALLSVTYVSSDGELVTGGGPTVKNVSGFDIPRLMVGSLGTLGLIVELILRTNPIPPVRQWLTADDADPFAARDLLQAPSAVLWDGTWSWILLEGHVDDVKSERARLGSIGSFVEASGPPTEFPKNRWSLAPADLRDASATFEGPFLASVGVGTAFATEAQPPRSLSAGVQTVSNRMKQVFDPTSRLNPGRNPGAI